MTTGEDFETRRKSAVIFGSERFIEVVLAFEKERPGPVPLKHLVDRTLLGRNYLNPILAKLTEAGALRQDPRLGGSRGPVTYDIVDTVLWDDLVKLASRLQVAGQTARTHS